MIPARATSRAVGGTVGRSPWQGLGAQLGLGRVWPQCAGWPWTLTAQGLFPGFSLCRISRTPRVRVGTQITFLRVAVLVCVVWTPRHLTAVTGPL